MNSDEQYEATSLIKCRSYERPGLHLCLHKRTLLITILCLQAPVLYFLYKYEVARMTRDYVQNSFWSFSHNVTLRGNITTVHQHKLTSKQLLTTLPTNSSTMKSVTERIQHTIQAAGNSSRKNNHASRALSGMATTAFSTASKITRLTTTTPLYSIENGLTNNKDTNHQVKASTQNKDLPVLPQCPETPPGLQGNLFISFAKPPQSFKEIQEDNPLVLPGGYFKPKFCVASSKVAIIIPFRDRDEHLRYFLQYMHPTLQRQQLEYRIYIINQNGKGKFNRAKLMNVGYAESLHDLDFGCFVFHDVDLILENDNAIYSCPERPRHLSSAVDKFNYHLPYSALFGGVTELTKEQFELVNGYPNSYWGWGGEDDDMYNRIRIKKMNIMRYPITVSRYRMISHEREKGNEANPERFNMIRKTQTTMHQDGLNSLKYDVVSRDVHPLYTNVTVEIHPPG